MSKLHYCLHSHHLRKQYKTALKMLIFNRIALVLVVFATWTDEADDSMFNRRDTGKGPWGKNYLRCGCKRPEFYGGHNTWYSAQSYDEADDSMLNRRDTGKGPWGKNYLRCGCKRPEYGGHNTQSYGKGCCTCAFEAKCNGEQWDSIESIIKPSLRHLTLTHLIEPEPVQQEFFLKIELNILQSLETADFSANGIQHIKPGTFLNQKKLRTLVMTGNKITRIREGAFDGLENLKLLYLDNNNLYDIGDNAFKGLSKLQLLDLRANMIIEFNEDAFRWLKELKTVYFDDFCLCCILDDIERCEPVADQCSSCPLIKKSALRILMWMLGICALTGNLSVIIWRVIANDFNVHSILIINLASSDFLMGIYMIIIAGADLHYGERYTQFSRDWKASFLCSFAGSISTLSSELSVFVLMLMSLYCAVSIANPSSTWFNRKRCITTLVIAWLVVILISFLPMFNHLSFINIPYFGENYYGRQSMCSALPLMGDRFPGWEYSIAVVLAFNLHGFIVIAANYIYIVKTALSVRSQGRAEEIRMASKLVLIALTDFFCCWFPIIVIGIGSYNGAWAIPAETYVWLAGFIIPLNSCINPYLIFYIHGTEKRRPTEQAGTELHTIDNPYSMVDE